MQQVLFRVDATIDLAQPPSAANIQATAEGTQPQRASQEDDDLCVVCIDKPKTHVMVSVLLARSHTRRSRLFLHACTQSIHTQDPCHGQQKASTRTRSVTHDRQKWCHGNAPQETAELPADSLRTHLCVRGPRRAAHLSPLSCRGGLVAPCVPLMGVPVQCVSLIGVPVHTALLGIDRWYYHAKQCFDALAGIANENVLDI